MVKRVLAQKVQVPEIDRLIIEKKCKLEDQSFKENSPNILLMAEAGYIVHFYLDSSGMVILIQMIFGDSSQK